MPDNTIQPAVLDMAGTTVGGLVQRAFEAAATAAGMKTVEPRREQARQYALDTMGQSKIAVFRVLLGDEERAQAANRAFEDAYGALIGGSTSRPFRVRPRPFHRCATPVCGSR